MDMTPEEYAKFKKEFWIWFDNLSHFKRKTFWYYPYDMAETNFFFTNYAKRIAKDERRENY